MTTLSLFELNQMVHHTLALTLSQEMWVSAEIAELREASSGHCYWELIEKHEQGAGEFRAKARATAWRNAWWLIEEKFRHATGQRLAVGMKTLLRVKVNFHEVYGYSLTISDIDPSYTMGVWAQRRAQIVQQLQADGVFDLNRELELPLLTQRIAIISSATAAGYGDFVNQIEASPYRMMHQLFAAQMQGSQVANSIIKALHQIAEQMEDFDVVVIIRGGGANTDLDGFESYELASHVAQFPLPIFIGIGHERDESVLDLVAHSRFKTPTAVAAFVIQSLNNEHHRLLECDERWRKATLALLDKEKTRTERAAHRLRYALKHHHARQQQKLLRLETQLRWVAQQIIQTQHKAQQNLQQALNTAVRQHLEKEKKRLAAYERHLQMVRPERLLRLGYVLARNAEGQIVGSAAMLKAGTQLQLQFDDGCAQAEIQAVRLAPQTPK